jgi:hypothetical protein
VRAALPPDVHIVSVRCSTCAVQLYMQRSLGATDVLVLCNVNPEGCIVISM